MHSFDLPRRLLFIDDDALIRRTFGQLLRNAGHTVEEADGGAAGLAILTQKPVDLVVTDLGMPGLTGWDVARAVKARSPHLPVVLVTGWANAIATDDRERALVDAILPKPCTLQDIQAVIGRLTAKESSVCV
ncbi:MAG TPA: response regulator [Candidatus Methylomirabilis sp.]|nr:response regulator [Candidatus Methylomirabilis sp.]